MKGITNSLESVPLPVISQLQDEVSVLARDKLNSTLMDDFGSELQRELVAAFEAIMAKLQDTDNVLRRGNLVS